LAPLHDASRVGQSALDGRIVRKQKQKQSRATVASPTMKYRLHGSNGST
jgi:hypothetical protein